MPNANIKFNNKKPTILKQKDAPVRGCLETPKKATNKIIRGKATNKLKKSEPENI